MVWYSSIYIAPLKAVGQQRSFWFDWLQEKRQVLRSDKGVERLDDKKEARAQGGRRFQGDRPAIKKDLDLAILTPPSLCHTLPHISEPPPLTVRHTLEHPLK